MVSCGVSRRWLVLVGAFFIMFLSVGTLKSNGLFINDMKCDLQTTTTMLGLAMGLGHGLSNVLALTNIPLLKIFSARQLMVSGALIGSLSLIFAAFSQSGVLLVLAMGISGACFSIVIFPSNSTSTLHFFPNAFENAMSFILTGGSIGMMLLPPISEWFHETYGWRGAVCLLGAMNLHCVVVGALMKPTETQSASEAHRSAVSRECSSDSSVGAQHDPTTNTGKEKDIHSNDTDTTARGQSNELDKPAQPNQNMQQGENSNAANRHDLELVPLLPVSAENTDGEIFISDIYEDATLGNSQEHFPNLLRCTTYLKKVLHLELFIENPAFIFPLAVSFFLGITYTSWVVFLIPNAVAKGYTYSESALLATTGGAANIAGRIVIGFILSRNIIRDEISHCFISLIAAIAFFSNTFATTYWSLVLLSLLNGFACGAKIVINYTLSKKFLPLELVATGICYVFFFQGLGEPVGGLLIGKLLDRTGSCVLAFNVVALIEFLSAILIISSLFRRQ